MSDRATPNLPSRDLEATSAFYAKLGFKEVWRDEGWMILERGGVTLEFFPHPGLDPMTSWFSCCIRLDDVHALFEAALRAGVPETTQGHPRVHRPRKESWGGTVGALIDLDGTLLRLIKN